MSKDNVRKKIRLKMISMTGSQLAELSIGVQNNLGMALWDMSALRVHTFIVQSALKEPDITPLLIKLRSNGVISSIHEAEFDRNARIPHIQFDAIIIPLIAFDITGYRIGRGGGWYDRFLATQESAIKIGVGFELQKVKQVTREAHDVALDCIVTEKRFYQCSNRPL